MYLCRTLVGNPCAKFDGYRSFVVHTLPQLEELDGKKVERSERIVAAQNMALGLRDSILEQQRQYQGRYLLIRFKIL